MPFFCCFTAVFYARLGWALPFDVWLSVDLDSSLHSGSPSAERLFFVLTGNYSILLSLVAWGFP